MSDAVDSACAKSGAEDRCNAAVDSVEVGARSVARPYAHCKATMKLGAGTPTAAARVGESASRASTSARTGAAQVTSRVAAEAAVPDCGARLVVAFHMGGRPVEGGVATPGGWLPLEGLHR